jgi:hypothetical protein
VHAVCAVEMRISARQVKWTQLYSSAGAAETARTRKISIGIASAPRKSEAPAGSKSCLQNAAAKRLFTFFCGATSCAYYRSVRSLIVKSLSISTLIFNETKKVLSYDPRFLHINKASKKCLQINFDELKAKRNVINLVWKS